jgi:predicted MFS family arabinose efflux permease
MFDRRKVALFSLVLALAGSIALAALAGWGALRPETLLGFCFLIGCGMALFGPSWQASVPEQVPAESLPPAIALNGISFNIARSFGPAVGGLIVASAGAVAAFVANALCYLPLIVVLLLWRRAPEPSRLPPERLAGAVVAGVRYIANSPAMRASLGRTFAIGMAGSCVSALLPLVSRDLLSAGAETYGVLLGCFGAGAVVGAMAVSELRSRLGSEAALRACVGTMVVGVALVAAGRSSWVTGPGLVIAGAGWTASVTICNFSIQLAAPRWVSGRAVAAYRAAASGGIALGSWIWGEAAGPLGLKGAMWASCLALVFAAALGFWKPLPHAVKAVEQSQAPLSEMNLRLAISNRSGPIVLEFEYRIAPDRARQFYDLMRSVQLSRMRNGGYGWSLARDVENPELWVERFHCPTWLDYLRQRSRATHEERELHERARAFHLGPEPVRIRTACSNGRSAPCDGGTKLRTPGPRATQGCTITGREPRTTNTFAAQIFARAAMMLRGRHP